MTYPKSKHFVKRKLNKESSLDAISFDFEKDDDDPFSMRRLSITILGIIIAFLTIFLPSISVLLGRPSSQGNAIIFNHLIKKDGS